jgi:hypothetical protein
MAKMRIASYTQDLQTSKAYAQAQAQKAAEQTQAQPAAAQTPGPQETQAPARLRQTIDRLDISGQAKEMLRMLTQSAGNERQAALALLAHSFQSGSLQTAPAEAPAEPAPKPEPAPAQPSLLAQYASGAAEGPQRLDLSV